MAGFCASADLETIAGHNYVLTPGRYVGFADEEDDGEPFEEKMDRLTTALFEELAQAQNLADEIMIVLDRLGYEA